MTTLAIDLEKSGFGRSRPATGDVQRVGTQLRLFESAEPDVVVLSFAGKVQLDRMMELDEAFLAAAELGRGVNLAVRAVIVGAGVDRKEGKHDDTDTLTVKLRIETVEIGEV